MDSGAERIQGPRPPFWPKDLSLFRLPTSVRNCPTLKRDLPILRRCKIEA